MLAVQAQSGLRQQQWQGDFSAAQDETLISSKAQSTQAHTLAPCNISIPRLLRQHMQQGRSSSQLAHVPGVHHASDAAASRPCKCQPNSPHRPHPSMPCSGVLHDWTHCTWQVPIFDCATHTAGSMGGSSAVSFTHPPTLKLPSERFAGRRIQQQGAKHLLLHDSSMGCGLANSHRQTP